MRDWLRPLLSVLFWLLVVIYATYPFTVPVFASGDGAGHVYWADVLMSRLLNTSAYPDFAIRQYLPPYALSSYYLAVVGSVVSGNLAEKSLVALCLLVFCTGAWKLVRTVSPESTLAPLLIVPFALHRYVFAGFYNFCLGAGLLAWTAAFWLANSRRWTVRRSLLFLVGIIGLYLAHPLALAAGMVFFGLHLAVRMLSTAFEVSGNPVDRVLVSLKTHRYSILNLAVAVIPAWHVLDFTRPEDKFALNVSWTGLVAGARSLWQMEGLLAHGTEAGWLVRAVLLLAALVLGVTGLIWPARRTSRLDAGSVLLFAGVMFLLYCWAPEDLAVTYLFSERFAVFLVIFLVAGAGGMRLPAPAAAALSIVAFAAVLMAFQDETKIHREVAAVTSVVVEAPPLKPGARGAIIVERGWERASYQGTNYWSCIWCASHYFRRSRATLLNAPWFYEPYWMLALRHYDAYWGLDAPREWEYFSHAIADPEHVSMPEEIDLLVGADCSNQEPEHTTLRQLANRYGLVRMPWSTRAFEFYARKEWAPEMPVRHAALKGSPSGQ